MESELPNLSAVGDRLTGRAEKAASSFKQASSFRDRIHSLMFCNQTANAHSVETSVSIQCNRQLIDAFT